MKNISLIIILIFLCGTFIISGDEALQESLALIEKNMEDVQTIQAGFVQTKTMAAFQQDLTLTGNLYIEKPDRFGWRVEKPLRYFLIIDGSTVRQWDEDSGEVQTVSVDDDPVFEVAFQQMTQWFYGEYHSLLDEYEITLLSAEPVSLAFEPREDNPAKHYLEKVTVTFCKDVLYLQEIYIQEKDGDSTLMKFEDAALNKPIDPGVWEFGK